MMKRSLSIICALLLAFSFAAAAELPVTDWLVAHVQVFEPAFGDDSFSLFDYSSIDTASLWPEEGQTLPWDSRQVLRWTEKRSEEGKLSTGNAEGPALVLAATYLDAPRWMKAHLAVDGDCPFQIFFEGDLAGSGPKTEWVLTPGRHRLLVAFIQENDKKGIQASLHFEDKYKASPPEVGTKASHVLSLEEALRFPHPGAVDISPRGSHFAITDGDGGLEICRFPEGGLVQTVVLSGPVLSFAWSPEGKRLAVATAGDKGRCDIWLVHPFSGPIKKIYSGITGVSQLQWLPDGKFIAYTRTDPPPEKGPYDLVDTFLDRWEGWKAEVTLWIASVETGVRHMITGGLNPYGFSRQALLSPDGEKAVFVHTTPSSSYPYRKEELWLVVLSTGKAELISEIETSMVSSMTWSPDSAHVAVIAPYYPYPGTPEDVAGYHSRWHQGIQLWDVAEKTARYLTAPEFNPCVQSLWWDSKDNRLYFIALDRTVHRLYRFDSGLNDFSEVELPFRNVEAVFGRKSGDWVVLRLAEVDKPSWLVALNLKTKESRRIWDKGKEFLSRVRLGGYEMFSCKNRHGTKLDGWIYLPPDFDPGEKYPAVISYYGGVVPQTESFGGGQFGRINHWLAGNGYVVYTMTPRGTWGYGQEFADAHFNEWGTVSSPDIIDSVKALIKAKMYIDPQRIGGFGHSYGGFEGLSLATQTDLFAAIIATGVISNTLNYSFVVLGQPNMGEIVLPGVYPWNRKDVYVDRSPVFNADKIVTPILLMQGTDDPWCEMTESDQMFSALRVQGKEVVQIRWIGEGHGIRSFSKRVINENIRREWFDKYLKDEPEGWQARYDKAQE